MEKIFYTQKEADKLRDCQIDIGFGFLQRFFEKGKFLKRSRHYAHVLIDSSIQKCNQGFPFVVSRKPVIEILVEGKRLEYLDKHEFTNPKNPFKSVNR